MGCADLYCVENDAAPECRGLVCSYSPGPIMDQGCSISRRCTGESEYKLSCDAAQCTCAADGVPEATIPYDPAFCEVEFHFRVEAATAACGWDDL